jgi:cysteine desulfurase
MHRALPDKDMTDRIYLDWNATAPLRPVARTTMLAALDRLGNPSSVHAEGRATRHLVETAREAVAALVGADARNVIFTSGGTEANALALSPAIERPGRKEPFGRLLISAIEHPSVRSGGRFAQDSVEEIGVTGDGVVDLADLARRLNEPGRGPALVSIMHANNETGVVQPIAAAADLVHAAGGVLHVDAVQTAGRIPCDIAALGADLVTISSHKIGGPQGAGALVKASEALHFADPLIKGGGQERGARAGTENVAGIAAFGAAAAAALVDLDAEAGGMRALRDRLEAGLRSASPDLLVFGAEAERLPNTTLFALSGMKAETAVIAFDLEGVAVSSGAACSSGKVQPSHVLAAMGVPPQLARAAVRVSLGPTTTQSEIDRTIQAWIRISSALPKETRGIAA